VVEDTNWFEKTIKRVAEEELGDKLADMLVQPRYYVDFLRYFHLK
jgi:hypothetical protein